MSQDFTVRPAGVEALLLKILFRKRSQETVKRSAGTRELRENFLSY
jgi:hypothetical protein